jgi:hypothetical protein
MQQTLNAPFAGQRSALHALLNAPSACKRSALLTKLNAPSAGQRSSDERAIRRRD